MAKNDETKRGQWTQIQKELTRAASVKFSRQWLASRNIKQSKCSCDVHSNTYPSIFHTRSILQYIYIYQHEKHLLLFCLRKIIVEVKHLYLEKWFNPLCPRPPVTTRSFSLPRDPRPPCSSQLADTPH